MVPHRRARQLPAKGGDHVGRVDAVAGAGEDTVDGAPVGDHGGLGAEIEEGGLQDGTGDGEGAGVGADAGAQQADDEADDDGEEGDHPVRHEAGPEGPEEHGGDADEGEEADDQGGVFVRRGGEEEGEGGPETGEGGAGAEAHEAGLDEERVGDEDLADGVQDPEVVDAVRVGGRVVGHEEPEQEEDEILQAQGEPVDVAPRGIFRHHAGQQASKEQAEEEAGRSDGESAGPAVRGSEVADQWKHCSPITVKMGDCMQRQEHGADILSCGVTVVTEVIKVREQKTAKDLVRHSPSLFERSPTISVLVTRLPTRWILPHTKRWR